MERAIEAIMSAMLAATGHAAQAALDALANVLEILGG